MINMYTPIKLDTKSLAKTTPFIKNHYCIYESLMGTLNHFNINFLYSLYSYLLNTGALSCKATISDLPLFSSSLLRVSTTENTQMYI